MEPPKLLPRTRQSKPVQLRKTALRRLAVFALMGLVWLGFFAKTTHAEGKNLSGQVKLVSAFANLKFERPLFLTNVPDGSNRLVVLEQAGRVTIFPNKEQVSSKQTNLALDITDKVRSPLSETNHGGNEEGLLGLAFHPKFKDNGYVFLHYTAANPRRGVIARFQMDNQRKKIKPDSQKIILELKQPWSNHNGGMLAFGPDGYLYLVFGDGGSGGDPKKNGQNLNTLFASILRIDVDHTEGDKAYAIPDDNPFVDRDNARGEIWAYGLRNAWRFSFDSKTGDLWAGDVGQNQWEEIDRIKKGGNYGWRYREGKHQFKGTPDSVDRSTLIDPVIDYPHKTGLSVTGGYVYRGDDIPALQGMYVYGDFATGTIWALRYDDGQLKQNTKIARKRGLASFGTDGDHELYLTSFSGKIFRFAPEK